MKGNKGINKITKWKKQREIKEKMRNGLKMMQDATDDETKAEEK